MGGETLYMGNSDNKLWEKICAKPRRTDITMQELHRFLINIGFSIARQNSSHRMYHIGVDPLTIPCRNDTDTVKAAYIKKVYDLVLKYELMQ